MWGRRSCRVSRSQPHRLSITPLEPRWASWFLEGISRPTYSQPPREGMSGKGLSPEGKKSFQKPERLFSAGKEAVAPLRRFGSQALRFGSLRRSGEATPTRSPAAPRGHEPHTEVPTEPHTWGARRGAATISSIPSNEFRDNAAVWICFLLGSSRRGRGRKKKKGKEG